LAAKINNMKHLTIIVILCLLIGHTAIAQVYSNWRGPDRDGKYLDTGLLKQWPDNGPKMIWAYEKLGKGFSSAVISNNKIYVTGVEGDDGFVYELSMNGELLRKIPYGKDMVESWPGSRSTPTIAGNLLYLATGVGKILCIDLETATVKWIRDLFNEFDGKNNVWGLTENMIVDGEVVYCSPGGKKNNVIALNRFTGQLVWSSEGMGEISAYGSPLLINHNGRRILVSLLQKHILGLDPETGKLLWHYPFSNQHEVHPNTPIYHDGSLYCFSGYGNGGVKLKISDDGKSVSKEWFNADLDNQMGGAILKNGYIYGSGQRNRNWFCIDWETGKTLHQSRDIDVGTVIYADGMLYAYTQRGELALMEPQNGKFRVVSKTTVELGSDQHWAHLVIDNGILYVRHGNALMAYNIKLL
jgi:outer membrane protein assembly factor BamB